MTELIILFTVIYLVIGLIIDLVIQLIVNEGRPFMSHIGVITLWPAVLFEIMWGF